MSDAEPSTARRNLTRPMLIDDVYESLRDALLDARIEPGARLNMDALARERHVSNTPIRRALERLVVEGLVVREPYRGFVASPLLDSHRIRHLYEFRLILEPSIAGLASRRSTQRDRDTLAELADPIVIARAIETHDTATLGLRDTAFHLAVASCTDNPVLREHLSLTLTQMRAYTLYSQDSSARAAWDEHRRIAQAISAGRPANAAEAMREHLHNSVGRMRAVLPR